MKKLVALVALTIAIFASSMTLAGVTHLWPDGRPILMDGDGEITLLPMPLEWSSSAYITIGIRSGMKSMIIIAAEGVMTLVANQLPLPNVVSLGITYITSPVLMASAVAVSAIFVIAFVGFNGPGPPYLHSGDATSKLDQDCSVGWAGQDNPNLRRRNGLISIAVNS